MTREVDFLTDTERVHSSSGQKSTSVSEGKGEIVLLSSLHNYTEAEIPSRLNGFLRKTVSRVLDLLATSKDFKESLDAKKMSSLYSNSFESLLSKRSAAEIDASVPMEKRPARNDLILRSLDTMFKDVLALPSNVGDGFANVYLKMGGSTLCVTINVAESVLAMNPETKLKPSTLVRLFCYLMMCMTASSQHKTFFVNIDDKKILDKALKFVSCNGVDEIVECLPTEEIALALGYDYPESVKVYSSDKAVKIAYEGITFKEVDMASSKLTWPSPDFDNAVWRGYVLFAFLLATQKYVTLDTETTGLDFLEDRVVSVGLSFDTHLGFYMSVEHKKPKSKAMTIGEKGLIRSAAMSALAKRTGHNAIRKLNYYGDNEANLGYDNIKTFLMSCLPSKFVIYHNSKFDWAVMKQQFGMRAPLSFDTMIAHYICRPVYDDPSKDRHGIQYVAVRELGVPGWKGDITKCQREHKDIVAAYNARDTCYTHALFLTFKNHIDHVMPKLFYDIDMRFVEQVAEAEIEGICVDKEKLLKIDTELRSKMNETKELFKTISGDEKFNINSGPQLSVLFWEKAGLKPIRKCKKCLKQSTHEDDVCAEPGCGGPSPIKRVTPAGKPSLDKYTLADLANMDVDMAKRLVDYRVSMKMTSSYTNLWQKAHPMDGALHPSYQIVRTSTGRLSCSSPNFQMATKQEVLKRSELLEYPKGRLATTQGESPNVKAKNNLHEELFLVY